MQTEKAKSSHFDRTRGFKNQIFPTQDTKENIVAVVGGYSYGNGDVLDSTEFLRNGEWSPGN